MAPRVLIVDDEPPLRRMLQTYLTQEGYEAVAAVDGVEGLKVVRDERVDVVLLDLIMPDMDGLDFLRSVKAEKPDLPVVIMTGFPTEERIAEAVNAGADDYLAKPFQRDSLLTILKRLRRRTERVAFLLDPDGTPGEDAPRPGDRLDSI